LDDTWRNKLLTVNWKTLVGFMTETEAVDLVTRQGIEYTDKELEAIRRTIAESREYVQRLPSRSNRSVAIQNPQPEWSPYLDAISSESLFEEHTRAAREWRFVMVDPRDLVVFQTMLNMDYVTLLENRVPSPTDAKSTLEFCVPSNTARSLEQLVMNFNPTTNTFSIITDNLDFRILGNVQGQDPHSGRRFLGFAYGGGLPQISVAEYKGRYILKNGLHRAYVLAQTGHETIPALMVRVSSYSDTGAQKPGFFPVESVMGDKPPLLGDFFSQAAVSIKRRRLKVIISVHAEVQAIPV
jgi:hypothetical protein